MPTRLWLVIAGNGMLRIAGGASGVLVGIYIADLVSRGAPMDAAFVGLLAAISFGAELLGAIPFGFAADFVSTRLLMSGGAAAAAIAAASVGVTREVGVLMASRVIEGLAAAAGAPALLAYLTNETTGDTRARAVAMSYFEMSLLAGLSLGGLLGSQLWRVLGASAFLALGGVYVAASVVLAGASAVKPLRGIGASRLPWNVLRAPALWRLAPVWLCMNMIVGVWLGPTFYFLLTHRSGSGQLLDGLFADEPTWLGVLLLAYGAVFGAGLIIWSRVLPRMRLTSALRVSLVAMLSVCGGLFAINNLAGSPAVVRWGLTSCVAVLIMVESGFTPAALSLLAGVAGDGVGRGAAMGIYSFLLGLGALLGSLLAGAAGSRWSVDGLIWTTFALALLALGLLGGVTRLAAHTGEVTP